MSATLTGAAQKLPGTAPGKTLQPLSGRWHRLRFAASREISPTPVFMVTLLLFACTLHLTIKGALI
jgi:hypothetical protein